MACSAWSANVKHKTLLSWLFAILIMVGSMRRGHTRPYL